MKLSKTSVVNLFFMAAVIALGACSAKPARDVDAHYDISVEVPSTAYGTDATVMLRRVDIRGIQSGRPLVQISGIDPVKYQEVRGHYWHVSAPTLLERAISTALATSSADAIFGTSANMQNADFQYSIDMRLFAYEPGKGAHVIFGVVVKDKKGRIVLSETYQAEANLTTTQPADAVNALGNALSAALTDMATDLADAI